MKLKITHIIMIVVVALFAWLYATKPVKEVIVYDTSDSLLKTVSDANRRILVLTKTVDSLNLLLNADSIKKASDSTLIEISKEYEDEIKIIDDNSLDDDIEFFRTEFTNSRRDKR